MQIVSVDIGGTHARFAIAEVADGRVLSLEQPVTLKTADHASLQTAWEAYAVQLGRSLPRLAGIAVACPVGGEILKLTNNPWIIRTGAIKDEIGLDAFTLVNDFGAVGHAVAQIGDEHFAYLSGSAGPLPRQGVISIIGPGTGLGVAYVLRSDDGYQVRECEGGHIDFAPIDETDDAILRHLRRRHLRVSAERVVSGPSLVDIYRALGAAEGHDPGPKDDKVLWADAMRGGETLAARSLTRFCLSLGSVAGDMALAHGASGVVIAGGLGLRLAHLLPQSGFASRFAAKGRMTAMLERLPVRLITHPQPGLYGAAAAFAAKRRH